MAFPNDRVAGTSKPEPLLCFDPDAFRGGRTSDLGVVSVSCRTVVSVHEVQQLAFVGKWHRRV